MAEDVLVDDKVIHTVGEDGCPVGPIESIALDPDATIDRRRLQSGIRGAIFRGPETGGVDRDHPAALDCSAICGALAADCAVFKSVGADAHVLNGRSLPCLGIGRQGNCFGPAVLEGAALNFGPCMQCEATAQGVEDGRFVDRDARCVDDSADQRARSDDG